MNKNLSALMCWLFQFVEDLAIAATAPVIKAFTITK